MRAGRESGARKLGKDRGCLHVNAWCLERYVGWLRCMRRRRCVRARRGDGTGWTEEARAGEWSRSASRALDMVRMWPKESDECGRTRSRRAESEGNHGGGPAALRGGPVKHARAGRGRRSARALKASAVVCSSLTALGATLVNTGSVFAMAAALASTGAIEREQDVGQAPGILRASVRYRLRI